ncbi:MAG TPA: hypothetical protein VM094_02795 [Gemmatimonadales bacterium]|nr:hypothetical protein [Gemmatimonadales bacterium]
MEQDENGERRDTAPPERAEGPERRAAEQSKETGDRDKQSRPPQQLAQQEIGGGDPVELARPEVGHLGQHGEPKPELPHEAGGADGEGRGEPDPGPGRKQRGAERREQHAGHDREADERHAELGQHPQPQDQSQQQPLSRPVPPAEAHERVQRRGPDQLIHDHRLQQVGRPEEDWAGEHAEGGQALSDPPAAQLPGDQRRQHHHRAAEHRREEADRRQRVAQQGAGYLGDDGDRRREVHSPELEMPPHAEIQQLVAVEAVRRSQVHRQVQGELERRLEQHETRGERRP